jgi:anti-sigma factor RsiW/sensor domain CHASE-containing protein
MISPQSSACPDENELVMSLNGLLTPSSRAELERHIDQCDRCRSLVATVVKVSVQPEEDQAIEVESGPARLPRGTNLGRYVLLDCIGRGGMAVVYAAYDPELDRKVAVKLLRTDLPGTPSELRASLLREAQAMARLTHPHVIAVYDVGTFNDQVFLAMEFIRGRDLRTWLAEAPRSWSDILQIFLKAGEGLRAAHESELAHRDFKPDNVLVGYEGQVRVTDFGLALRMRTPEENEQSTRSTVEPKPDVLAGTPLYISPEQWRGQPADARSDQFSFCVSLYEALYGARPYPGKTSASYAGVVPPPPKGASVPGWVRRVLIKGLSLKPEERHTSMRDLLAALSRGLMARKYRTWAVAAVLILIGLSFAVERAVQSSAQRAVEADLGRTAELFRVQAMERQGEVDRRAEAGLKKDFLSEALGKADDLDARLGLAAEPEEQGISYAHDLIRSGDLPLFNEEDVLLFVDAQGHVVYNRADENKFGGDRVSGLDILDEALQGRPAEALWSPSRVARAPLVLAPVESDNDLLLLFARPITRGRKTLGALVFGRWVRESFLPALEQSIGDRVVLREPDRAQAATIDADLQPIAKLDASPTPLLLQLGQQRVLVQSVELAGISGGPLGRAFLVRNFDPQVEPILWRFRRDAIKYGLLGIALPVAVYLIWRARSRRQAAAA